jgi:predicted permease
MMRKWQIKRRNADLERELRSDLDLEEEEQRESGRSPEEAHYAARRAFGNEALIQDQTHEAWGWSPVEHLLQDLRYGLRQMRRAPAFTATILLILALGIGAVTAVFSLINAALIRMLPVQNPERLVQFKTISPSFPVNDAFSYPTYKALRTQTPVLDGALAFRRLHNVDFEVDGRSSLAEGQVVSGNYFSLLGVRAALGRTLQSADESVAGQNAVAVISYDYWRSRFALDPGIVGKKILLNNAAFTVIGVTEPEFDGLQPGAHIDVSVPLTTELLVNPGFAAAGTRYDVLTAPYRNWLYVMGHLRPGIAREQAAAGLQPVFAQSMRAAAEGLADAPYVRQAFLQLRLQLDPAGQGLSSLREQFSRPLWIVMAIVGFLLLIACANVAGLLLARAHAREREIAVRCAIGAGAGRILRQLMTESLLLALAGAALGMALAWIGSRALLAFMQHGRNPVTLRIHPDPAVLVFALSVTLLTAMVFGAIPAWRAAHSDPAYGLAPGRRIAGDAIGRHRFGKSLIILQVALSLVLLAAAGLLTRTLANLSSFYPGFNRDRVLLFSVDPTIIGYKLSAVRSHTGGSDNVLPLYEQLLARIRAIPGVRSASLSVHTPLSTNVSDTSVRVQGTPAANGSDLTSVDVEPVGPDYFATLQTPLLRGREFTADDRSGTPEVAIVNQSMARHYFGDADPLGRLISIPLYRGDSSWMRIVGEVRDVKVHDLREPATLMLYVPMLQAPEGAATFEIRTAVDPASIQTAALAAVQSIDRRLPVYGVKTLNDQFADSMVEERLVASLSSAFGLLALLLTGVGLYGLAAYGVNRRVSEIGVRMALGAQRSRITRMILRETLFLVGCGMVLGMPAAALASRLVASQLFGVRPGDPLTFTLICVLMAIMSIAATYLPARRAASIDPMQALRSE